MRSLRSSRLAIVVGAIVLAAGSFALGSLGYFLGPFAGPGDPDAGEILALVEPAETIPAGGRITYPQDGLSFASGDPLEVQVEPGSLVRNGRVLLRPDSPGEYFVAPHLMPAEGDRLHTVVLLPEVERDQTETWAVVLVDFSETPLAERPGLAGDSPLVSREAATFSLPGSAQLVDAQRIAIFGERSPVPTATAAPMPPGFVPVRPGSPDLERITFNQVDDYTPAFSPDGASLVYASSRDGLWNVYLLDLKTRGEVQLTSGGNAWNPAFSPDGGSILFSFETGATHSLFRFDVQRRTISQITGSEANDYHPREQVDGSVAFSSDRDGGVPSIFVMDSDTKEVHQVTDDQGSDYWPSWSPDGSLVVFDSNRGGNQDLYLLSVEGGDLTQATSDPGRDAVGSFSPDGRWLVFESERTGTHQIYVMDMADDEAAGEVFQMTDFPLGAYVATFSSGGQTLVFQAQTEDGFEIFIMPFPLR